MVVPVDPVIYRAYLYVLEDGLVGLIRPLIINEYTLPRVKSSKNGIFNLFPLTVQELI